MNSLTLNNNITQLRCRVSISGFQYEAMINNQWQPVTHQFAEIVWDNYRTKQRALVKVNPLSYIVKTLAKSSVEISLSEFTYAHYRAICGFFVLNALVLPFNYDLGNGTEKFAGVVCDQSANVTPIIISMVGWAGAPQGAPGSYVTGKANLVQFTSNQISLYGGELYKLTYEGCLMTTIPNEIVPNKTISISQIDVINKKLLQVEAILHLLTVNSTAEAKVNDKLVANILWATTDLVADARYFLHNDKSKEVIL